MEITTDTLAEAHECAVDAILEQHKEITIQTHKDKAEFTLEFEAPDGGDDCIVLHILHPSREPMVSKGSPFQDGFTKAYRKQFLSLTPPRADGRHPVYTYYNRLEDHPFVSPDQNGDPKISGNGDGNGIRQLTEIVNRLHHSSDSRRAVAVTWNPVLDAHNPEPPCMLAVQAVIRNGKMHLRTVFRSQDMLLGLPENLVGIQALQEFLVDAINVNQEKDCQPDIFAGEITLVSLTPHIYKKRDTNYLQQMQMEIHRKKTMGLWHPIDRW